MLQAVDFYPEYEYEFSMTTPLSKKIRLDRKFCPHCEQYVAKRTYREHYVDFYQKDTSKWTRKSESRLSVAEYPGLDTGDEENRTELETKAPTMSFEDFDEHEVSSVIY